MGIYRRLDWTIGHKNKETARFGARGQGGEQVDGCGIAPVKVLPVGLPNSPLTDLLDAVRVPEPATGASALTALAALALLRRRRRDRR